MSEVSYRFVSTHDLPHDIFIIQGIDRTTFRDLLHNTFHLITEDVLVERMFCCWDRDNEGSIRLEPWIIGLDVFLRGNLRDRMEFSFRVYDLNNDSYITKDEIFQLFKWVSTFVKSIRSMYRSWRNSLLKQPGEEDPDEGVRDLSELVLKKFDQDHDGKISFQDYETVVKNEPLLLQAFGQCLPTDEVSKSFLLALQSWNALFIDISSFTNNSKNSKTSNSPQSLGPSPNETSVLLSTTLQRQSITQPHCRTALNLIPLKLSQVKPIHLI